MNECEYCGCGLSITSVIKENVWGAWMPVEWTETCNQCGYKGLYSYGSTEIVHESDYKEED